MENVLKVTCDYRVPSSESRQKRPRYQCQKTGCLGNMYPALEPVLHRSDNHRSNPPGRSEEANLHEIWRRISSLADSQSVKASLPALMSRRRSASTSPCQSGDWSSSGRLERSSQSASNSPNLSGRVISWSGRLTGITKDTLKVRQMPILSSKPWRPSLKGAALPQFHSLSHPLYFVNQTLAIRTLSL